MSIDLDDIERRIADGIYGDDRMTKKGRNDAFSALNEIIAEMERLRAGVAEERAAVVAYLRADAAIRDDAHGDRPPPCWTAVALRQMANDIERGDHRPEEGA